jgi:hypothetical protein
VSGVLFLCGFGQVTRKKYKESSTNEGTIGETRRDKARAGVENIFANC